MPLTRRDFLTHGAMLTGSLGILGNLRADMPPTSRFLEGNFAPVREEVTVEKLAVIGRIPDDLAGCFVRNGPNPQFAPKGNYHWFDGDGMLHGVQLRDGKASYRNRYIQTAGWKEERDAGKSLYTGLMEPPDLKKLLLGDLPFKNAANTALVWHAEKLLALWEGGDPYEVKPKTLETVGRWNFAGKLKHAFTAHPKIDPKTGEMITFGYDVKRPYIRMSVINRAGELVRSTPIELKRPTMMHDFAITSRYVIFPDQPETFDFARLANGGSPWYYDAESETRFGLVPREGDGKPVWFTAKPGFFFHSLNAYDAGTTVVLIACRFPRFPGEFQVASGPGEAAKEPNAPVLYRWVFDLKTGTTQEGPMDDVTCEFPRINEMYTGQPTQFGYTGEAIGEFFGGFRKYDLTTGKSKAFGFGKDRFGGEGVFVPRPNATAEDDGYLLTLLHDAPSNRGELLIVDAKTFAPEPLARVKLPVRVPYGFHGTWIPDGV